MTLTVTLDFLLVHPSRIIDTRVVTIDSQQYSVIEYDEHITFRKLNESVDIGYIKPCIMTTAIDVYTCDEYGRIAGIHEIERPDDDLPIDVIHKKTIEFIIGKQRNSSI